MPRCAVIAWAGVSGTVDLDRAVLIDPAGRPILTPNAPAVVRWRILDRSPVSVRLGGVDAAGSPAAVCRFEVDEAGLAASIEGAVWHEQPNPARFTPEVAHGHVPLQDRA